MEHFNNILFHNSGPANRQHTYQSINQIRKATVYETINYSEQLKTNVTIAFHQQLINYVYYGAHEAD